MLPTIKKLQKFIISSMMIMVACTTVMAQTTQPIWWFGVSGAANLNLFDGTTQRLNNSLIVPTAFHKGLGIKPYGSFLMEYRPGRVWGGMLNIAYDDRGGKFNDVIAPCDCPATLKAENSYLAIEPSIRLGSASSNFYFYAGPRVGFNFDNEFAYTQLKQPDTNSEFSSMRKTVFSGQVGVGYDFDISSPNSTSKVSLSPFVSFHPYFGQDPREIESWTVSTLRTGVALKFGKGKKAPVETPAPLAVATKVDVYFSVRAPKAVPLKRQVSETLPLRNSVFFDEGSVSVPVRYIALTSSQASDFREEQLQKEQSENMTGRSARQMNVYYNILNIIGDRLRSNPGTTISLSGASARGPQEGKAFAEAVKQYIVGAYGIDGSRINTQGRTKPLIPSEQPGATKELALLRAGDRRVDIESTSPELLMEVGGGMMKPVQILTTQVDPLDSHIVFNVTGAKELLKSWSVDLTDDQGAVQHYGPFTRDQESVQGRAVLGYRQAGTYKVSMLAETTNGLPIRKETTVSLVRQDETTEKGFRYSILFDFDKDNSVASYDKFLTDVVTPLISNNSKVIIHGYTDIIGEVDHNHTLSHNRAVQTQKVIEQALAKAEKNNVKFESLGFGEDQSRSPFENNLPEERFYNRTVIIDIVPTN
ncbi:MAG TPA: flagellar motor protein MotB [Sphingobacteriaceae bacterium]